MKIYTYSKARENLAAVLEESKKEVVVIRRRKGDLYTIAPKTQPGRSPFDVTGLKKALSRKELIEALRESRERPVRVSRKAR